MGFIYIYKFLLLFLSVSMLALVLGMPVKKKLEVNCEFLSPFNFKFSTKRS